MLDENTCRAASSHFSQFDYCSLGSLSDAYLSQLESNFDILYNKATGALNEVAGNNISFAEYYMQRQDQIIAVPESDDVQKLCRFEYIAEQSNWIKHQLIPLLSKLIHQVTGEEVVLFKDKCNLKSPGGGAFTPHQDISAYLQFGPKYHITAAIFLDEADEENGALQMASNYRDISHGEIEVIKTERGELPFFPIYDGGKKNGEIITAISEQLKWTPLATEKGGIVLFNSYVPHFSHVNRSSRMRRAFFFTFNLKKEGDQYSVYYSKKRQDYMNPMFHIATPTEHSGLMNQLDEKYE